MYELWFLRSARCLMLIDIYMKFCEDSLNRYRADKILWQSPREITQKSINAWVIVLVLCMSSNVDWYLYDVREDSLNSYHYRADTILWKSPRKITQTIQMQELWFFRSARRLSLIDIYTKFREDSLKGFQVKERTRRIKFQRNWLKKHKSKSYAWTIFKL